MAMRTVLGVFGSDSVNLYNSRFTPGSLVNAHRQSYAMGRPMLLSHDMHRPVGWNSSLAVYFTPGLTRLVGVSFLADQPEDQDQLQNLLQRFLTQRSIEKQAELDELKGLLSTRMDADLTAVPLGTIAFHAPELAAKTFPDVFAQCDDDGLVPLDALRALGPGVYQSGDLTFFAHSYFRRSFSRLNSLNAPFLERLLGLDRTTTRTRLALDRDMVGLASTYLPRIELEYWWGPKFSDDLKSIPVGEAYHEASSQERLFHGISGTSFRWGSRDGQHIFESEEVRDIPSAHTSEAEYGCRYVHSLVEEDSGRIIHLDGAVRLYSEEAMLKRVGAKLADAERAQDYVKLWRLDGEIPIADWKSLVSDYYRDNHLVGEYLGAERNDGSDDKAAETRDVLDHDNELVLYSIAPDDGIRLSLALHKLEEDTPAGRRVETSCTIRLDGNELPAVDAETLEFLKALRKRGAGASIDTSVHYVDFHDNYVGLPVLVHAGPDAATLLNETVDCVNDLLSAWNENGRDMVVGFTVGFPIDDVHATLSVYGHIESLCRWCASPLSSPPNTYDDLEEWADNVAKWLQKEWPEVEDRIPVFALMSESGLLEVKRTPLRPTDYGRF